jgi:hypothetical protein
MGRAAQYALVYPNAEALQKRDTSDLTSEQVFV